MRKINFIFIVLSFNHAFAGGNSVGTMANSRVGTMNVIQSSRFDNSSVGNFKVFKSDGMDQEQ